MSKLAVFNLSSPMTKSLVFGLFSILVFAKSGELLASGFQDLAASRFTACVVDQEGSLKCEFNLQSLQYPPPDDDTRYIDVALGSTHGCAITTEGEARCWGDNSFGQLNAPSASTPFESIEAGANHSCAMDQNAQAWCWGLNTNGQTNVPTPGGPFAKLVLGATGSCAIDFIGAVVCWSTDESYPSLPHVRGIRDLSPGERCMLTNTGDRFCLLNSFVGEEVLPFPTGGDYVDMESGNGFYCARNAAGSIDCNPANSGNPNSETNQLFVSRVSQMPPVSSFSIFRGSALNNDDDFIETALCGLTFDGRVSCVGTVQGNFELFTNDVSGIGKPTNVRALRYSDSSLEIFWEYGTRAEVRGFNIYRNDELFTFTTNGGSYVDRTVEANTSYTYALAAVDLIGVEGERSETITIGDNGNNPTDPSDPTVPTVPAVPSGPDDGGDFTLKNLSVQRYGEGSLELFWDRPANQNAIKAQIFRNGINVTSVPGNSYFDDTVNSVDTYQYTIVVLGENNQFIAVGSIAVKGSSTSCQ